MKKTKAGERAVRLVRFLEKRGWWVRTWNRAGTRRVLNIQTRDMLERAIAYAIHGDKVKS